MAINIVLVENVFVDGINFKLKGDESSWTPPCGATAAKILLLPSKNI